MIDVLVVAKSNRYGLSRDAKLLAEVISDVGLTVDTVGISDRTMVGRLLGRKVARLVIHVERVSPQWLSAGVVNVLVPNQERYPRRQLGRLRRTDMVLAKTIEAHKAFSGLGIPVELSGFTSEDRFEPSVPKNWNRVLHVAGGSTLKGTEDVLALWNRHPEWPELVIVQKQQTAPMKAGGNVTLKHGYMGDGELRRLQNECGIHVCPSRSEGWGHHIVEALSCGSLVVTTDGGPMNEHVRPEFGWLVPPTHAQPRHLGTNYFVGVEALEGAISVALEMPSSAKASMGDLARQRFLEMDSRFRVKLHSLLEQGRLGLGIRSIIHSSPVRSLAAYPTANASLSLGQDRRSCDAP